ncbi:hypothetical protein NDU88_001338 [Pleurodeles waltl]|uniref:Uncharacterized protein n=1 Tax=Pleurodeles waltl TaxID=8319 RepID=A0AAV7P3N6_PLEWA|nr:hypothetical protein NDU88_001338 [Pleurodeles waltl]
MSKDADTQKSIVLTASLRRYGFSPALCSTGGLEQQVVTTSECACPGIYSNSLEFASVPLLVRPLRVGARPQLLGEERRRITGEEGEPPRHRNVCGGPTMGSRVRPPSLGMWVNRGRGKDSETLATGDESETLPLCQGGRDPNYWQ